MCKGLYAHVYRYVCVLQVAWVYMTLTVCYVQSEVSQLILGYITASCASG